MDNGNVTIPLKDYNNMRDFYNKMKKNIVQFDNYNGMHYYTENKMLSEMQKRWLEEKKELMSDLKYLRNKTKKWWLFNG